MWLRLLGLSLVCVGMAGVAAAQEFEVVSPDGTLEVRVEVLREVTFSVAVDGETVLRPSAIGMTLDNGLTLGKRAKVRDTATRLVDETIEPAVPEKRAVVRDHCNELTVSFEGDYALVARAYDDGAAYRWAVGFSDAFKVRSEQASFVFSPESTVYRPHTEGYKTSFESDYEVQELAEWEAGALAFAPVLVAPPDGPKVVLTEAALLDYAGMFLTRAGDAEDTITGDFAGYPAREKQSGDRYLVVEEHEDYIAQTEGPRVFPWRVAAIARADRDLIGNDIVYRLAPPLALEDPSWIRPGRVAWDWWNSLNVYNVDFRAGINNATYKYYIDFAADHGIEYIILDEGWSNTEDLFKLNPAVDLHELIQYGNEKGVGLILWCVWLTLERQPEALAKFSEWGVKGVKVDFMDRDDQKIVRFYERLAKATAEHHLLLDFHGAYKPTGLRRAYPNLITREGVMGLEYSKWSRDVTPEYDVMIPFIRMVAGPMDYTPGAMNNAQRGNFRPIMHRPMSQGTRCHQAAMYVVYESPVQMFCDTPSAYVEEPDYAEFLTAFPSTWHETVPLAGELGEYVAVARRHGEVWYIGAMAGEDRQKIEIPLAFLGEGAYDAVIYKDGVNAHRIGIDHVREERTLRASGTLELNLAPGGGWAAQLRAAQ